MMNVCKLSIIVPAHNAEYVISNCLRSLVNQVDNFTEIIVVDSDSSDQTLHVIQRWSAQDRRIICFHTDRLGVSHARNVGLHAARGRWVCFVDADDYVYPDYYRTMASAMSANVDLLMFGYDEERERHHSRRHYSNRRVGLSDEKLFHLIFEDKRVQGYVWNKMFRLDIIHDNAISFNEDINMNEDLLFCFQYIQFSKKNVFLDSLLYCYVKKEHSAVNGKLTSRLLESNSSFQLMQATQTKNPELTARYVYVARQYMNCCILKTAIKYGYTELRLVREVIDSIRNIGVDGFWTCNLEVKVIISATRLFPNSFLLSIFKLIPNGIRNN